MGAYYAAAKAGLTFLPLNYRAKEAELEYMINTAGTKVLLVGDRYVDLINSLKDKLPGVRFIAVWRRRRQAPATRVNLSPMRPSLTKPTRISKKRTYPS